MASCLFKKKTQNALPVPESKSMALMMRFRYYMNERLMLERDAEILDGPDPLVERGVYYENGKSRKRGPKG